MTNPILKPKEVKVNQYCFHCCQICEFQILTGQQSVVAWGSSHVVAWGSSHVVAWESSHVEAWGRSHVEAWGRSHVEAWGRSHVEASKYNSVTIFGKSVEARGGVQIHIPEILTAKEWCDYYGVNIKKGIAVLFKATDENFETQKGVKYLPKTIPEAPDWDGGKKECGGGLHFSPHPQMALEFRSDAKRFVACPVQVKDIVVHKNAVHPQKIKAKKCCAPVWEVDRYGNRL